MLRVQAAILVLFILAIAAACDRSTAWPPQRAQLAQVFDQQKATFVLIEQEMAADGLLRMGPALFAQSARNPTIPKLPSNQAKKYLDLFERVEMFVSVVRHDESTEFELLIENIGPRLYVSRFIHGAQYEPLPNCAPTMQEMACGSCSIHLERDWLLEYNWFPASPEDEARDC